MSTRCLDCHTLTQSGPRCTACTRTKRRTTNASRVNATGGSGWAWSRVRRAVLERDGYRCVLCGLVPPTSTHNEVDHIVPLAEGGTSDMANLRTLCTSCHAKRGKG